jgi:hypothetical protein
MSQNLIAESARNRMARAVELVEASLTGLPPFDPAKTYTPKELEPYDALSDRFVRATEASLKFFRSYERAMFAENSDTLRDLLSRMHKLSLVSSVQLWIAMRDIRNRLVHDYLPEKLKELNDMIMGEMGAELSSVKIKVLKLDLAENRD